ncbi:hypothetical protein AB4Y42_35140 [Paraburkholderia sp. EG286B]|uniref:hypothetical protein n=1 Tax=Paraburkholderia sp. EG286B TaxID=3237011 RepID=UPI0034D2AC84
MRISSEMHRYVYHATPRPDTSAYPLDWLLDKHSLLSTCSAALQAYCSDVIFFVTMSGLREIVGMARTIQPVAHEGSHPTYFPLLSA